MAEPARETVVSGRYRVDPAQRLAALDQPSAQAFAAGDVHGSGEGLFALICKPNLPPRAEALTKLTRQRIGGLLSPYGVDTIHWPPDDGERVAIVFPRPGGQRLALNAEGRFDPFSDDRLIHEILPSLVGAVGDMGSRYLAHRAIRADNLFFDAESARKVTLGECVSAPAGYFQPVLYETIQGGQAMPAGRGPGRAPDDFYALGVLIAVLLFGGDPLAGQDRDGILLRKITQGSCAAIVGNRRVSASMIEVLRGLLCDDLKERWGIADLRAWLSGRRMSPKQVLLPRRASRSISIARRACEMDREVAQALASHWDEGLELASSGELDGWVRRSLGDDERGKQISAFRLVGTGDSLEADLLLTRAIAVLDPQAPIRFRQVSASLEGLPKVLATGFGDDALLKTVAEMIQTRLPLHWMEMQTVGRAEMLPYKKLYEGLYGFLSNSGFGYGIERCLYEANENWPCMSPVLARYRVSKLDELLPALERVAAGPGGSPETTEFVDRHIAAFCWARQKTLPTALFQQLDDRDDLAARRLAKLRLLAEVQATAGPASLPALTRAMTLLLEPVIQSFHNRPFREDLIAQVEAIAAAGDLMALLKALDDSQARRGDQVGFDQARALHQDMTREIAWLDEGGLTDPEFVRNVGRQVAAVVSTLAAVAVMVITVAVEIFHF